MLHLDPRYPASCTGCPPDETPLQAATDLLRHLQRNSEDAFSRLADRLALDDHHYTPHIFVNVEWPETEDTRALHRIAERQEELWLRMERILAGLGPKEG